MRALGMIETMGLIPSIEALDAMLKAANVETLEKTNVRGGIVTVIVIGDVAAAKTAVDAGAAAVERLLPGALLSQHVIPRPDIQTECLFKNGKKLQVETEVNDINDIEEPKEPEAPEAPESLQVPAPAEETEVAESDEVQTEETEAAESDEVQTEEMTEMEHVIESPEEEPSVEERQEEAPGASDDIRMFHNREELEAMLELQGMEAVMQILDRMRASEVKALAKQYENGELQENRRAKATKAELLERIRVFYTKE